MEKRSDEFTQLDTWDDGEVLRCPNCGSHTLRAFDFKDGEANMKCLTCGNEFKRPAFKNPEAKVADKDNHKFMPGQRVQMTHPNYKGQRGSIVDFSGKHADLGEEQYEIQLDNGEKITSIPESAFSKIKSAGVHANLPNTPLDKHFLDSETFLFEAADGDTIPLTDFDDNDTDSDYNPDVQDSRFDDELPEEDPECPMCHGPGTPLGALGARQYYRCRNCGMDWSEPRSEESEKWNYDGEPDNLFGHEGPGQLNPMGSTEEKERRVDTKGNKLEAGRVYLMKGKDYKVPDLVRILNLEDNRIEATIASEAKGHFPIVIEAKDEDEYSFDPVEDEKKESAWKIARRDWSSKEQRELIEENPNGRARNIDKLDLSGTHYELKSSSEDPDFLWG